MKNMLMTSAIEANVAALVAAGDSLSGARAPAPAPAPAPAERQPVTARGADLLAMIADAGDAGLMLTMEEGLDAVNAGHAVVDTATTGEGGTAKVTLTDAGRAELDASGNTATGFEIEDGVEMPTNATRRGRQGGYPFENLNIGQSFHVAPVTKDGKTETPEQVAARLQSSVSGARQRFAEEIAGETETVNVKVYAKNEDGSFQKDEDGKRIVASETPVTRPKTRLTRDFKVMTVGASDPKGAGARVWRVALSPAGTPAPAPAA
jgi:hypothetical protein